MKAIKLIKWLVEMIGEHGKKVEIGIGLDDETIIVVREGEGWDDAPGINLYDGKKKNC